MLIDSQERYVASNVRAPSGMWLPAIIARDAGVLDFTPLAVKMSFEKIYANTSLDVPR